MGMQGLGATDSSESTDEVWVPPLWWSALGPIGAGMIAWTGISNLNQVTDVTPEVNQAIQQNKNLVDNSRLGAMIVLGLIGFFVVRKLAR